jgi:hypothetical protein
MTGDSFMLTPRLVLPAPKYGQTPPNLCGLLLYKTVSSRPAEEEDDD